MKNLKYYPISREQFEATEYRPSGVEVFDLETDDGWNYGDVIENAAEYHVELAHDAGDVLIWRVFSDLSDYESFIVEVVD